MDLFLGIDGGGTGCRAAVADAAGSVLGCGQAGPANIASDPQGARANILLAARAAMKQAIGADQVEAALPGLAVGMGLAGANANGAVAALLTGLPFDRIRVESDAVAAVRGALRDRDGIVAALGTGSVFARQAAGTIRQIGGWGLILGDEGSGAWIGRAILSAALRASDGFDKLSPLVLEILDERGGPDGVVRFALAAKPVDFAALAPRVIAARSDTLASRVLAQAIQDVGRGIDLLQGESPVPVTFIGGLGSYFAAHLSGRWTQRPALGTALDGALMLARGL
jgi:glucosamine kinase